MSLVTAYVVFRFFRRLGPIGLFILGALDSSFLFMAIVGSVFSVKKWIR